MKQISVKKYVEGVNSIYVEQPSYQLGHDGSDGTCDCIGMSRGGLKRGGATDVTGMSGTNYAARKTIRNLEKIQEASQLCLGDVVLKIRDKDDPDMPLPDRYRKGGSDYSSKWGETNFTHIGTVTKVNPLEITHMTSPMAKKDTKLGKWAYAGQLPWVSADADAPEEPEIPEDPAEWATVWADKGKTVKMRAKPSTSCRLYWDVPIGSQVMVTEPGDTWSGIIWAGQAGYMMSKYLYTENRDQQYTVTITGLDRKTAEEITSKYGGVISAE